MSNPGPSGVVYFVVTEDRRFVKIGWTRNIKKRFLGIRSNSPIPVELPVIALASPEDERSVLNAFATQHSHGEWFHLCEEIEQLIKSVRDIGQLPNRYRGIDIASVHILKNRRNVDGSPRWKRQAA